MSLAIVTNYAQQWTSSSSTAIRNDAMMASGSNGGSIFIIGGFNYPYQVTEYDITNDIFIDHGENAATHNGSNFQYSDSAQWYTQQQTIIYMIDPSGTSFNIYDMVNQIFQDNWMNINFHQSVSETSCLTSSTDYLFVTGGGSGSSTFSTIQMFHFSTLSWVSEVQHMQTTRRYHSCIVDSVKNDLYNIGGGTTVEHAFSIEKILITSIAQKTGIFIGNLTEVRRGLRSVFYKNNIIVVGGLDINARPVNIVHIISTNTAIITVLPNVLVNAVRHPSVILVDGIIYSFGGDAVINNKMVSTNACEYYPIDTNTPTKFPVRTPLNVPMSSPSNNPTKPPETGSEEQEPIMENNDRQNLPDAWVWIIIGIGACACMVTVFFFFISRDNKSNGHIVTMVMNNIHQKHKTNVCEEPQESGIAETNNVNTEGDTYVTAKTEGNTVWMFPNSNDMVQ
eukprot:528259_1